MKNTEIKIYLDMDGVLVNFDKGYAEEISNNQQDTSKKPNLLYFKSSFWENLEWLEGGQELFKTVTDLFKDVYILSSKVTNEKISSRIEKGKYAWLNNNIPQLPKENIILVGGKKEKSKYATPTSVLIDDTKINIENWNANNGIGFLYNKNKLRSTIEKLKILSDKKHTNLDEIIKDSINELFFNSELSTYLNIINELKNNNKLVYDDLKELNFEGYGAGNPVDDPKAVGRWTVKFDSSNHIINEATFSDLYIGYIDLENFHVYSERADIIKKRYPHEHPTHAYYLKGKSHTPSFLYDSYPWRFRSDTGILYWWQYPKRPYIEEVEDWIEKNINKKVKNNVLITPDSMYDSHLT